MIDVVGSTFSEVVLDPTKAVLVLVYAPWCGGSRAISPLIDQVSQSICKYFVHLKRCLSLLGS